MTRPEPRPGDVSPGVPTRAVRTTACVVGLAWTMAVVVGCRPAGPAAGPGDAKPAAKPVPVQTVTVASTTLTRTSTQPATVHAYYEAAIRPQVTGYVREIRADIGEVVAAGAPLAEIDVPELVKQRAVLDATLARQAAERARAAAGVELARAGVRSAEAMLAQAGSQIQAADADLAALDAEFSRTSDLVGRQSLQPRMLDESRQRRDASRANRDAAQSAVTSAEARVAVAKAEQTAAEADLAAAQAETTVIERRIEALDVQIGFATLKAPFDGVVTARRAEPGDLVTASGPDGAPLFVVAQVDRLRVRIDVPEADAASVDVGDAVSLTFPSFAAEQARTATVTRIASALDAATRTMRVEVDLENADGKLLPGMFGQATITVGAKTAARVLPARAVRFDEQGRAFVYVVDDADRVTVTPVTLGADQGTTLEILSGVEAGRSVIDAHLQRFVDGQTVARLGR